MIRIALCDDEAKILDEVSLYIKKYAGKKNNPNVEMFRFDSAKSLRNALDENKSFDIFYKNRYDMTMCN